jgi:hypothetical protein
MCLFGPLARRTCSASAIRPSSLDASSTFGFSALGAALGFVGLMAAEDLVFLRRCFVDSCQMECSIIAMIVFIVRRVLSDPPAIFVSRSSGKEPGRFRSVQLIAVCLIVPSHLCSIRSLSICLLLADKPHIGCRSREIDQAT